jgi:ABC-type dipeptide/oligopeptide/nickel transport system permease component
VAFVRLIATAIAIVLTLFAVMSILGVSPVVSSPLGLTGNVVADLFRYLPPTLELIVVSFIVASIVGFVSALPSVRSFKPVVTSIALVLQCIPFFCLAIAAWFALNLFGALIGVADPTSSSGHLARVIFQAVVLTMFQFPLVVEYFNSRPALGLPARAEAASIVAGLATQFVNNLPDIIAAAMISEIFFVLPGEGRLFWGSLLHQRSTLVGFLLFMALLVLVTRFLVDTFARRTKDAMDSHV